LSPCPRCLAGSSPALISVYLWHLISRAILTKRKAFVESIENVRSRRLCNAAFAGTEKIRTVTPVVATDRKRLTSYGQRADAGCRCQAITRRRGDCRDMGQRRPGCPSRNSQALPLKHVDRMNLRAATRNHTSPRSVRPGPPKAGADTTPT
jgi:hypothetical protein